MAKVRVPEGEVLQEVARGDRPHEAVPPRFVSCGDCLIFYLSFCFVEVTNSSVWNDGSENVDVHRKPCGAENNTTLGILLGRCNRRSWGVMAALRWRNRHDFSHLKMTTHSQIRLQGITERNLMKKTRIVAYKVWFFFQKKREGAD